MVDMHICHGRIVIALTVGEDDFLAYGLAVHPMLADVVGAVLLKGPLGRFQGFLICHHVGLHAHDDVVTALVVEPQEVAVGTVSPVEGDPAETEAHGLGHIHKVVDGLDVRDVAPVQPVIGTPSLPAAVDGGHAEMLELGILLSLGDLHFGHLVGIGAEGGPVKGAEMVLLAPGVACFAYCLEEPVDMLGLYRGKDGTALAAADVGTAGMHVRHVKEGEVVEGLVLGGKHIIGKGEYLLGQLLPELGQESCIESLGSCNVVKGIREPGLFLA